jgi:hypothetical protein
MGRFSKPARGGGKNFSKFSDRVVNSRRGRSRHPKRRVTRQDGHSRCSGKVGVRTASRTGSSTQPNILPCRCQSCDAR